MAAVQTEPSADDQFPFDQFSEVATVDTDRFCDECGYNLHTQSVRRDPRTRILLCRCPECGRYHAATDATTAGRTWLRRLSTLVLVTWMVLIISGAVGIAFAQGGIAIAALEQLTGHVHRNNRPYHVVVEYGKEDLQFVLGILAPMSFGLSFVGAAMATVVFAHWRRWGHHLLVIVLPVIPGAVVACVWQTMAAPNLASWGIAIVAGYTLVNMLGGTVGIAAGRPLARGLVRALLPPRLRGPLAYLWFVDGKNPPPVDVPARGPRQMG